MVVGEGSAREEERGGGRRERKSGRREGRCGVWAVSMSYGGSGCPTSPFGARQDDRGLRSGEGAYSVCAVLVPPADASGEPRCDQAGDEIGGRGCEVQRGGPVGVLADAMVFVAGVDEEFLNICAVAQSLYGMACCV